MTKTTRVAHEFVEFVPDTLEQGTLYISIPYASATHLCLCGCGFRVVTPFSPIKWKLVFEGDVVSIHPSIGNWSSPCRSHYWIRRNEITWAAAWTEAEIDANREDHHFEMEDFFGSGSQTSARAARDISSGRRWRVLHWFRRLKR